MADSRSPFPLFLCVLVVATCGLVYELVCGAVASYTLGDSITQFSLVIGLYLSAMGVGAWLSRFLEGQLAARFVEIELGVALIGGFSAPLLFFAFGGATYYQVVLYGVVFLVGVLVGLELPLLMRILRGRLEFRDLVSRVFSLDYLGGLLAAILFPILCVPNLGLVRTSLLFGLVNAAVGFASTYLLAPLLGKNRVRFLRIEAGLVIGLLFFAFLNADRLTTLAEADLYTDDIIYAKQTHYQRIIITENRAGFQLFLNGHLQFASADEYRYHEALVHPAMSLHGAAKNILVLGGGDGLAVREVLRHPGVEHITLVDLDKGMTDLARKFPPLKTLSRDSLGDPRVKIVNDDAMVWLAESPTAAHYDVAIVDFPDPSTFSVGKLYTTRFYRLLGERMNKDGVVVVQSTSPLFARQSFWSVINTLKAAGWSALPYHVAVPSFGVWGYALARKQPFEPPRRAPADLRFLDDQAMAAMFVLSRDLAEVPAPANRLDNQALVRLYESEWRRWE